MEIWNGNSPHHAYTNTGTDRSFRTILLLAATTTFLGPLFALAGFAGGWVIDSKDLPPGFNPTKLDMLNAQSSGQTLPKAYNPSYAGPYFDPLPQGIGYAVTLAYILSLIANILFPLKVLGPWRFRASGIPCLLYLIQAFLIFAALITFHSGHLHDIPPDRRIYSTNYFAAIISASLAMTSAICLITDYFLIKRLFKRQQGVGISPALMVLACCLVLPSLWCHLGAYVYNTLEGWHPLLGFYFSLATITTIGFGDFRAETQGGKYFLFVHTLVGIVLMVGLASSVKSAFKEIFLSGKAERIRRKSMMTNHTQQTNMSIMARSFSLDLGMLKTHFILALLNFSLLWVFGATIFMTLEDWPFFESLYFSFVSFSTIGYGDIIVKTYPGLLAFSCYTVYGMVAMSYFISVVAEGWVQKFNSRSRSIEASWWDKLDRAPPTWGHMLAPPIAPLGSSPMTVIVTSPEGESNPSQRSNLTNFLRRNPKPTRRIVKEELDPAWRFQL